MDQKKEMYWVIGGIALLVVGFFVMQNGGGSSSGLSFVAPNASSVAAVESAATAQSDSLNNLAAQKAGFAAGLLSTISSNKAATDQAGIAGNVAQVTSFYSNSAAIQTNKDSVNGAIAVNANNNATQQIVGLAATSAALGQTTSTNAANVQVAGINANSAVAIGAQGSNASIINTNTTANAAKSIATTNANASTQNALYGFLGNLFTSASSLFTGGIPLPKAPSTTAATPPSSSYVLA